MSILIEFKKSKNRVEALAKCIEKLKPEEMDDLIVLTQKTLFDSWGKYIK